MAALAVRPEPVADREDPDVEPVGDQAPQPAPREDGNGHGDQAEDDQVPGPVRGQGLLEDEEQDGAEDRPLDRADAADDGHEDHLRRPLHAERRRGLHVQLADDDQRAGRAAADRGHHEHEAPGAGDPHADAARADLVVAHGGEYQAEPAAQHQVQVAAARRPRRPGTPSRCRR